MSPELKALIEKYRDYKMTPEERFEQRISLAFGNGYLSDPRITEEGVRREAYKIWPDGRIPDYQPEHAEADGPSGRSADR